MSPQIKALWLFLTCLTFSASGATLKGRVIDDQTGALIATADVRLRKIGDRLLAANPDTDGEGRFIATDLAEGEYSLDVSKSNHVNAALRLHIASGDSSVIVRLVRGAVISGQVRNAVGGRISGTVMALSGSPITRPSVAGRTAGIDAQGQYRITNLPPGDYQLALSFASPGGLTHLAGETEANSGVLFYPDNGRPQVLTLSGGEERRDMDFVVSVPAFYTISGKIELPDPKARFMLALVPVDQPTIPVATVFSVPNGTFTFKGVPSGSYTLFATTGPMVSPSVLGGSVGADGRFARMHVDVVGENIEGLSLVSQPGPSVALVLRSTGSCPRSAEVALSAVDGWGVSLTRQITLNADEQKQVPTLAPVRFAVSVNGLGADCFPIANPVFDASTDVPQLVVVTIAPAGSIRGHLNSGSAAAIVLLPADGPVQVAFPDAESRFSFTGLRPGRYRIAARSAGDGPESRWIPDVKQMIEVQVGGGSAIEIDLAAPAEKK